MCCRWMDDFSIHILFIIISVISGHWMGGNERLCVVEFRFELKRFSAKVELEPGPLDQ